MISRKDTNDSASAESHYLTDLSAEQAGSLHEGRLVSAQ